MPISRRCSAVLGAALLAATAPAVAHSKDRAAVQVENHPLVRAVVEYRRAVAAGDTAALRRLQAPGARIWFEKREGEGRPLDSSGKGPWAAWDRFFHARAEALEFSVEGRAVRVKNLETNDWYELVEREPVPYYIVYFFDDAGRIAGKLVQSIPGVEQATDRLHEFDSWVEEKYPGLLQELRPDGRIDPDLEKARVWKEKLEEWRAETGLRPLQFEEP